jgi:hypothetical protein
MHCLSVSAPDRDCELRETDSQTFDSRGLIEADDSAMLDVQDPPETRNTDLRRGATGNALPSPPALL